MCPIELYAISLFIFFCPIAAIAPKSIEAIDKKIKIICHCSINSKKGIYKNLINTVKAAIFGTIVKNSVTVVGEPSYTSGAHIGNVTAEILKAKPTKINTIPKVNAYSFELSCEAIISKFVDPEKPYNNRPDESALKTKYFNPASDDFKLFLLNVAKTYKAKDCNSSPI